MKQNEIRELHDKTIGELQNMADELMKKLAHTRLRVKAGKEQNTHLSLLADDIARIKTVLGQKLNDKNIVEEKSTEEKS